MSVHVATATWTGSGGAGHNGGRAQLNIGSNGDVGVASEYPFLDLRKASVGWSYVNAVPAPVDPSTLDVNGYPTSITNGGVRDLFYVPMPYEITGNPAITTQNYVLKWTGDGVAYLSALTQVLVSYTITAASIVAGQCVITCATGVGNNNFNLRVGQPIVVSGLSGTGWAGANAAWSILAVDLVNNKITIAFNSGTGSATLTAAKVTNTLNTATADASGWAGQGRCVFTTGAGGDLNSIATGVVSVRSTTQYPHAMSCCHEDDEASLDSGNVFGVKFKQRLAEANFGVLRFEGWQHTDAKSTTSSWFTRRPVGHSWYAGTEPRASVFGGHTSGTGGAYTVAAPPIDSSTGVAFSTLHDKTTVQVIFDASASVAIASITSVSTTTVITFATGGANPTFANGETIFIEGVTGTGWTAVNGSWVASAVGAGTLTISLNSSGFAGSPTANGTLHHNTCSLAVGATPAKNILTKNSYPLTSLFSSYPIGGASSSLATLVYDATLDAWIKFGGDAGDLSVGISNGVPPEICLQLCIEMRAHPYFNTPMFSGFPLTDYIPQLASYCKTHAPSWMVPRFEGTNETFNHAAGFYHTWHAEVVQSILNGGTVTNGVWSTPTYNVSTIAIGAGTTDITLTVASPFPLGARVNLTAFGGTSWNSGTSFAYVSAVNVGGNPNKFTVNANPTGSYTSGGTVTPNGTDYHNWYGTEMSYVGQALANVYGINRLGIDYWCLAGVQTGSSISINASSSTDGTAQSNARLQSPWFTLNNNPVAPYTATPASNWVSHIATTQYYNPTAQNTAQETTWLNAFDPKKFVCGPIVNGVFTTVASSGSRPNINGAAGPLPGDTIFGISIPMSQGVKIATGGVSGSFPAYTITLTDLTINRPANTWYFGTDLSVVQYYADSVLGSQIASGTIVGNQLTVNSLGVGSAPVATLTILRYAGSPPNLGICSGAGPYTLSASPGNVTGIPMVAGIVSAGATIPSLANVYANWFAWAQTFRNTNTSVDPLGAKIGMTGYEGGYSPDYTANNGTVALDVFRGASRFVTSSPLSATGVQGHWKTNYDNFVSAGGAFPSVLQLSSRYPSVSVWSVLETIYQTPNPPQWLAAIAFNH